MTETVAVWARVLFGALLRRLGYRSENSRASAISHSDLASPIPLTTKRRGYDSPEVFRKDTLVRIKILQVRIEENAKRIGKIAQRMNQAKKVYDPKRLEEEDDSE